MRDHKAEAERFTTLAVGDYGVIEHRNGAAGVSQGVEALLAATVAQVHATLYLADQARIANMQQERGLLWQKSGRVMGELAREASAKAAVLDTQIREWLGL